MADQISQSGQAKLNPLPRDPFRLPVQWLVLSIFVKGGHRDQLRSSPTARDGMAWNGAGGWLILSQVQQVNFSRTVWIAFHGRGIT